MLKKNKIYLSIFTLTSFFVLLLVTLSFPVLSVNAQGYIPLAPIPGTTNAGDTGTQVLATYLTGIFKIGIAVAGALAFLMIVLGGFQYLSTDALTGKEEGKERVTHAVGGLILALVSFIILNTINPKLVALNLDFGPGANPATGLSTPANLVSPNTDPTELEALRAQARGVISANVNGRIQALADKERTGTLTPEEEQEKVELEIIREGTVTMNRINIEQTNILTALNRNGLPSTRAREAREAVEILRGEVNNRIAAMAADGATVAQMATVRRYFDRAVQLIERCIGFRQNGPDSPNFNSSCR
ncbi:MAG: pilin [Patescibacteria group bacterium]